ncbi:MAG: SusD/RagB family nutrient-binding outer membrane lipoprotein [Balneolaceae bacterium]
MIPIKKTALVLLTTVLLLGCGDFGDLNVDQNRPSEARTDLLLTSAQQDMSDVVAATTPVIWVQYIAETQYTDVSQYSNTSFDFNPWYTGPLQDLQRIIDLNTDEETREDALAGGSNDNQIAVARILQAYFFHMMTDRWGAIPYSDALQGRENFSPEYDQQEDIYADLINELNEAVAQMDDGEGVNGDILFDGDMERWAEFANSLRARVALRMSDVNAGLAESEFADAVASGLITEDVMFPYLAEAANENPWFTRFRTRTDYAISDAMADYMIELEDYRITQYADPAPDLDESDGMVTFDEINGMPYGAENAGDITNASISFPGQAIRGQGSPLPIITLAELNFSQAEAVERGWIPGDAEEFYLAGIEASWNQWNVYNEDNFNDYISNPEVEYGTADWQERIGNQKWIALFPLGYEAWAEWRRLDYPELEPHPFALNPSGEIPVRHVYPSTEAQLNTSNYEAAVAEQGPDTPDTNLWWDVE